MDALGPVGSWLIGPAMGGALVGLVWALARAIQRRSEGAAAKDEAEAATETASAKAVVALLAQLTDLRGDVDRERAAREKLEEEVRDLRADHDEEKSKREHYESQVAILQSELAIERRERQAAEGWAKTLASELADLRNAITGGHSKITLPPPRR